MTSVKSAFQSHSGAIRNTTVALVVFGLNEIVKSEDFFQMSARQLRFLRQLFLHRPCICFCSWRRSFFTPAFGIWFCGCCYYEDPYRRGAKRYCCCLFPRWPCSKKLVEILFQSSLSGFMWIFWALLQRDYFICGALGGTKEAKVDQRYSRREY